MMIGISFLFFEKYDNKVAKKNSTAKFLKDIQQQSEICFEISFEFGIMLLECRDRHILKEKQNKWQKKVILTIKI